MNIKQFNNIAIFQTAFIGDVVLTMPLVQAIRNNNPNADITFVTTPQAREIPEVCKAVNNTIVLDKRGNHNTISGIYDFAKYLNNCKFDLWISAHRSFRSSLISYLIKNPTKIGYKNSSMSFFYDFKVQYNKHYHEIERNLELLSPFSIKADINLKDVEIEIAPNIGTIDGCSFEDDNYVIIAPGSVWETKKWKEDYFDVLSKKLLAHGMKVYLSGSKSDSELCDRIAKRTGAISLAGLTNITQTLYLFKYAKLVITNDSAPTHFAGLMNTPVITIFGPTSPIFGFGPRSDKSVIIRNSEIACSPCRIHGSDKCPLGTHECMKSVLPEEVFQKSLLLI